MQLGSPIDALHRSLSHAEHQAFSDIQYQDRDWERYKQDKKVEMIDKVRRPNANDIEVVGMFAQTWPSTALGFGGLGGAAMTPAYTIVLKCQSEYCVYFGGRLAYCVINPSKKFKQDVAERKLASVAEHHQYLTE